MKPAPRSLRLLWTGPEDTSGVLRVTNGEVADWFFLALESQRGPAWKLSRLVKGQGITEEVTACLGGGGSPPFCTCDGFTASGGKSCDHIEAMARLREAGKIKGA